MKNSFHIILAGGSGMRFWPQSRQDYPKQLLKCQFGMLLTTEVTQEGSKGVKLLEQFFYKLQHSF